MAKKLQANPDMKGLGIDVSLNDEVNQWGQNVSAWVAQSKEERQAKKDRYYVGNGKVVWTDGATPVVPAKDNGTQEGKWQTVEPTVSQGADDLPF